MDRQDVVKLFLKNGFQLSENTLSLVENNPEKILSEIKKINPRPFIITKNHLEKIPENKEVDKPFKIKLSKEFKFEKKCLEINDYVKHFTENYEKIKEILKENKKLEKIVSVNKIIDKTNDFSLIASVREKNIKNLLVEDPTGEIHLFFDENLKGIEKTEIDDILGFVCDRRNDRIYIKDVIYPEVSITRKINRTEKEVRLFYIYKPSLLSDEEFEKIVNILRQTKKTEPIFVFGNWEDKERLKEFDNLFLISKESFPSVFDLDGVKILTLPMVNDSKNILDKKLIKNNLLNTFVVEEIPDIIFSSDDKTYSKNYKGSTIISNNDKDTYFIVNLQNRGVEEKKI